MRILNTLLVSTLLLLTLSSDASAQQGALPEGAASSSSGTSTEETPSETAEGADVESSDLPDATREPNVEATEWGPVESAPSAQVRDAEVASIVRPLSEQTRYPMPRRSTLALSTTFGGLLGVGAGFGLAWGPALGMWNSCKDDRDSDFCGLGSLLYVAGASWITPATTALGVWTGGHLAGGRGRYDLTLLGSALGGTFGSGLLLLGTSQADSPGLVALAFMSVPALEWVGALVAYHLSHKAAFRERELRLVPGARVEQGGASLQLMGRF